MRNSILLLVIGISAGLKIFATEIPIAVDSPRGGEVYCIGQTQQFHFHSSLKALSVELSRDGGAQFELLGTADPASRLHGASTFTWAVAGAVSNKAILRVSGQWHGKTVSVNSSPFSISDSGTLRASDVAASGAINPGNYKRVDMTIGAGGQVTGIASGGPIDLGIDVTGQVRTANIADVAVTSAKISSGPSSSDFVLTADGNGGAQWLPLAPGNANPLAPGSISGPLLADGAVTNAKLANKSVSAEKINSSPAQNNLVLASDGNGGALWRGITTDLIQDGAVTNDKISGVDYNKLTNVPAPASGVPAGFSILGATTTSPPGFTYSGLALTMNDAWAGKSGMPTARAALGIASSANGKLYAIGGINGGIVSANEEYDPTSDSWAVKANMPTARDWLAVASVNGKIFAIGGFNGAPLANNECFDPASNTWSAKAPMPTARSGMVAAVVDGRIYLIGGDKGGSVDLNTNEVYDPASDTWASAAGMPTARTSACSAVINGIVYVIGGSTADNSIRFANNEAYNPATNIWSTVAPLPTVRQNLAAGVLNNRIYVMGGTTNSGTVAINEEYDPLANGWATRSPMPTARTFLAASALNGRIYAVGGSTGQYLSTNEQYGGGAIVYVHTKN